VNWCVLDIETIPSQDPNIMAELSKEVKVAKNLKDADKISASREEKLAKAYADTSFDPLLGSICAIGVMTNDGTKHLFTAYSHDPEEQSALEAQAIADANTVLNGTVFAWNGRDFDFRFLGVRAMRYNVERPVLVALPSYLSRGVDPMRKLFGYSPAGMVSLSRFAKHLGIKHDDSFDGSMVAEAFRKGEYSKITAHLDDDIETLYRIVRRCYDSLL
jgi:predicted PolB exonuclease-like 3'-5' exonuclease